MTAEEKDLQAPTLGTNASIVPDVVKQFFSDAGKKGGAVKGVCKKRGGKRFYKRIGTLGAAARKRNAAARKVVSV